MVRYVSVRPVDFLHHPAWIGRDLLPQLQAVIAGADQRLFEMDRIVRDGDPGQVVAIADQELGHRRLVAAGQAAAAHVVFLEVGGGDLEHDADPPAGGIAGPGVRGVLRGVPAPVRVDRPVHRAQPLRMVGGDPSGNWVDFLPDSRRRRTACDVVRPVGSTLPFGQALDRRIPQLCAPARAVVDRDTEELAEFGPGNPLLAILMHERPPVSGQVHLRLRRGDRNGREHKEQPRRPRRSRCV